MYCETGLVGARYPFMKIAEAQITYAKQKERR